MTLLTEKSRIGALIADAGTFHWGLLNMDDAQLDVLEASPDTDILGYVREMLKAMRGWSKVDAVDVGAALYELYAEAIALNELKRRADERGTFKIRRVRPEKGKKAPDFECDCDFGRFYIEVKTPDIVAGVYATRDMMKEAKDDRDRLRKNLKPGVNVGEPQIISPHGEGASSELYAKIIDDYRRRIDNNLHKDQITKGPTFVLVYDGRIGLDVSDPSCLTPAYFDALPDPTPLHAGQCVSGDWWRVGFGRAGELVMTRAEFPGAPNLSGHLVGDGILIDRPYLLGLSVMTEGRWSNPDLKIFTLAQTHRALVGDDTLKFEDKRADAIAELFSDDYNDASNSRGGLFQVRGGRRPVSKPAIKPKFQKLFAIAEPEEVERASLVFQGAAAFIATPSGVWWVDKGLSATSKPERVELEGAGRIEGLYASNGDLYLMRNADAGGHSLLRTRDEFRTLVPLDWALIADGVDKKYAMTPNQMQVSEGVLFTNAGAGRNFLVSADDAASWKQLEGSWGAQACYPGCFLVSGRNVLLGGECPMDSAYLSHAVLRADYSGWSRAPRSVAPVDLSNRNVQFIEAQPKSGLIFAGVEGGLLRSDTGGRSWDWSIQHDQAGDDYPYIQHCIPLPHAGVMMCAGFNKPKEAASYLALSTDHGLSWIDASGSMYSLGADMRQVGLACALADDRVIVACNDIATGELVFGELVAF